MAVTTAELRSLLTRRHLLHSPHPNPAFLLHSRLVWSMKKDPALESALSRNRRWIVNNQIKHILLRDPAGTATVRSLQKRFKTLDLQGNALNWLHKYPCCFETYTDAEGEVWYRLTKRMAALVEEEEDVREAQEGKMAKRLAKVLMLSRGGRMNVVKLNELKRSFGFADDYILRFATKYPGTFRIVNYGGRRNSMDIELVDWDESLAVSAIEAAALEKGKDPEFTCSLPSTWVKSWDRFREFNEQEPYVTPYRDQRLHSEKRAVAVVHEFLSLTLWKKASILKLGHFRREFGLPERLNRLLLRHPGIFYVSNRYKIHTVVLREGYVGSELACKDPLVVVKQKFGELMQEGLHEYNRRRHRLNLEKQRNKGELAVKPPRVEHDDDHDHQVAAQELKKVQDTEERRRFYKTLFDDIFPSI